MIHFNKTILLYISVWLLWSSSLAGWRDHWDYRRDYGIDHISSWYLNPWPDHQCHSGSQRSRRHGCVKLCWVKHIWHHSWVRKLTSTWPYILTNTWPYILISTLYMKQQRKARFRETIQWDMTRIPDNSFAWGWTNDIFNAEVLFWWDNIDNWWGNTEVDYSYFNGKWSIKIFTSSYK